MNLTGDARRSRPARDKHVANVNVGRSNRLTRSQKKTALGSRRGRLSLSGGSIQNTASDHPPAIRLEIEEAQISSEVEPMIPRFAGQTRERGGAPVGLTLLETSLARRISS